MKERGHRVTIVTNGHFEPLARQAGLDFLATSTSEDYLKITQDPDLWHPKKAFFTVAKTLMAICQPTYDIIADLHAKDGDQLIVVGTSLALSGRLAQEKLGVPMASVHLAPAVFQSAYDMPRFAGFPPMDWSPIWVRRALYKLMNFVVDRALGPSLNAYRRELGLQPVKNIIRHWWHSPQLVLAMFPDWFGKPQKDWPINAHAVGFPLYDERGVTPLSPELEAFLDAGTPPIAFTPGSAMFHGEAFFAASAEACRIAGRRGLLLTRQKEQIPATLPPGVIHVSYAPFSELLPRCAAVVHHGGIGSSAQALAAGVPQIIQPFAHDQPDNANRLHKLGVSRTIWPKQYTPLHVAAVLTELLKSETVAASTKAVAERLQKADALGEACDRIEALAPASSTYHAVAGTR